VSLSFNMLLDARYTAKLIHLSKACRLVGTSDPSENVMSLPRHSARRVVRMREYALGMSSTISMSGSVVIKGSPEKRLLIVGAVMSVLTCVSFA